MLSTSRAGYEQRIIPISGLLVCDNPKVTLCSNSIGMGVVVAGYDPIARIGGLFHAMLPDTQAGAARAKEKPGMFVDAGMEALCFSLQTSGAVLPRVRFFAVGGAQVMGVSTTLNIGQRNTNSLHTQLASRGIQLAGSHLGGHTCRSFYLAIETGEAAIMLSGQLNEISL